MGHSALTPIWDIFGATSLSLLSCSKTPISVASMLNQGPFSNKRGNPKQIHPHQLQDLYHPLAKLQPLKCRSTLRPDQGYHRRMASTLLAGLCAFGSKAPSFQGKSIASLRFFPEAPALCKSIIWIQTSCPPSFVWVHLKCPAPYTRIAGSLGLQRQHHISIP